MPGRLILRGGTRADYRALEQFHYVAGPPATWAGVWTIEHEIRDGLGLPGAVPVAVGVLSYPCLNCHARERALNLAGMGRRRRQRFVNENIRTISRLIVHPTYRGLGLASILIQCILENCPTRYVEALAAMARGHPMFAKAGMREFAPEDEDKPSYFLFENRKSTLRAYGSFGRAGGRRGF